MLVWKDHLPRVMTGTIFWMMRHPSVLNYVLHAHFRVILIFFIPLFLQLYSLTSIIILRSIKELTFGCGAYVDPALSSQKYVYVELALVL